MRCIPHVVLALVDKIPIRFDSNVIGSEISGYYYSHEMRTVLKARDL